MKLASQSLRLRMTAVFKSSIMEKLYAERLERDTLRRKLAHCGVCVLWLQHIFVTSMWCLASSMCDLPVLGGVCCVRYFCP